MTQIMTIFFLNLFLRTNRHEGYKRMVFQLLIRRFYQSSPLRKLSLRRLTTCTLSFTWLIRRVVIEKFKASWLCAWYVLFVISTTDWSTRSFLRKVCYRWIFTKFIFSSGKEKWRLMKKTKHRYPSFLPLFAEWLRKKWTEKAQFQRFVLQNEKQLQYIVHFAASPSMELIFDDNQYANFWTFA